MPSRFSIYNPEIYMQMAIDAAWKYQGLTYPNPPVGAVVLDTFGMIAGIGAHEKAGGAHAEVNALKAAYRHLSRDNSVDLVTSSQALHNFLRQNHNNLFHNATLFTTLEPCNHMGKTPPCSSLISDLGIKTVYMGIGDKTPEASGGMRHLFDKGIKVHTGILEKQCSDLIEPFKHWNQERFVFLKWGQSLNGSITDGYLTCDDSLCHVHALRDKIDLLVIGGETIRQDKPLLDARRVDGKAPDVLILSNQRDFDMDIPLFHVPERSVFIEDRPDRIENYNFVMIESGGRLTETLQEYIHWTLVYIAPMTRPGFSFSGELMTEFLSSYYTGCDMALWGRYKMGCR